VDGQKLLLVGSPLARYYTNPFNSQSTVGAVQAFTLPVQSNNSLWMVWGQSINGKFGYSLAFGYPYGRNGTALLAVGLPSHNGQSDTTNPTASGAVLLLDLSLIRPGTHVLWAMPEFVFGLLMSPIAGSRFGWTLCWQDINHDGFDDLLVTAPLYAPPSDDTLHETGTAVCYTGGQSSFPNGTVADAFAAASWQAFGYNHLGRLGTAMAVWDSNGDGLTELVLGEPRSLGFSNQAEMAGTVRIYSSPMQQEAIKAAAIIF